MSFNHNYFIYVDFSIVNPDTGERIVRKKTLYDLYVRAQKSFDLDFLQTESAFIVDQLGTVLDVEKSKKFYQSVRYFDKGIRT